MKLKEVTIQSFLGIDEAAIKFDKPVTLFAGKNNSGKSSVRDAIVFGLTGKARATTTFKDAGLLANSSRSSSKGMSVQMELEDDSGELVLIGRSKSAASFKIDSRAILRYCLDPRAFLALPARDRGSLLAEVLGGGLKDIAKAAIVKHIGNVDKTVLAELKANGVDILLVDVFKDRIVEMRKQYKRDLAAIAVAPPLLGDYDLDQDYDLEEDKKAVDKLAQRIQKGAELIAKVKEQQQIKAGIIDITKGLERMKGETVEVPALPPNVSAKEGEQALLFMELIGEMLNASNAKTLKCCLCEGSRSREKLEERLSGLLEWADTAGKLVQEHDVAIKHNADIEAKIESHNAELKSLDGRLSPIDAPNGSEKLLADLQEHRDQKQANLAAHCRYTEAMIRYTDGSNRRTKLEQLVKETNRIDGALKDGGPVKSDIAKSGRKLPINEELLKLWGMEALEWSDNGEIWLAGVSIEYASDSEKYRASCVMGLALADISKVGIAALDGFDILLKGNRNAFMQAVRGCNLNNILVFCSTDGEFTSFPSLEWLDIFMVKDGKVTKV